VPTFAAIGQLIGRKWRFIFALASRARGFFLQTRSYALQDVLSLFFRPHALHARRRDALRVEMSCEGPQTRSADLWRLDRRRDA
jgi:hypothetical protein